jgi:hypothetical protein
MDKADTTAPSKLTGPGTTAPGSVERSGAMGMTPVKSELELGSDAMLWRPGSACLQALFVQLRSPRLVPRSRAGQARSQDHVAHAYTPPPPTDLTPYDGVHDT